MTNHIKHWFIDTDPELTNKIKSYLVMVGGSVRMTRTIRNSEDPVTFRLSTATIISGGDAESLITLEIEDDLSDHAMAAALGCIRLPDFWHPSRTSLDHERARVDAGLSPDSPASSFVADISRSGIGIDGTTYYRFADASRLRDEIGIVHGFQNDPMVLAAAHNLARGIKSYTGYALVSVYKESANAAQHRFPMRPFNRPSMNSGGSSASSIMDNYLPAWLRGQPYVFITPHDLPQLTRLPSGAVIPQGMIELPNTPIDATPTDRMVRFARQFGYSTDGEWRTAVFNGHTLFKTGTAFRLNDQAPLDPVSAVGLMELLEEGCEFSEEDQHFIGRFVLAERIRAIQGLDDARRQRRVDDLTAQLQGLFQEIASRSNELNMLGRPTPTVHQQDAEAIADSIVRAGKIIDISLSPDHVITVKTDTLYAKDRNSGAYHEMGKYAISIPTTSLDVRFTNLTRQVDGYRSQMQHPHVFNDGHACQGNFSSILAQLVEARDWIGMAEMCVAFLQEANNFDIAGSAVYRWPFVEHPEEVGLPPYPADFSGPITDQSSSDDDDDDDGERDEDDILDNPYDGDRLYLQGDDDTERWYTYVQNRDAWVDDDGYDRDGYDDDGYDRDGRDREGYDREGYDVEGYNEEGYDRDGYGDDGYNREGLNRQGLTYAEATAAAADEVVAFFAAQAAEGNL